MSKNNEHSNVETTNIKVFCRIKPNQNGDYPFSIIREDQAIEFELNTGINLRTNEDLLQIRKFKFDRIFDENTKQDEVFERIGRPYLNKFIQGYNCTVFAYGQSGSGKTHSISYPPDAESQDDVGLVPRCIEALFEHINQSEVYNEYEVKCSYIQLYRDKAYDLLSMKFAPSQTLYSADIEDFNKLNLVMGEKDEFVFSGLNIKTCKSRTDALENHMTGEMNRAFADTPLNETSTRSHCIFTIYLKRRLPDSHKFISSKFHIVDLAGSERVWKSNIDGQTLEEAKYINSSLFFLHKVIQDLNENPSAPQFRNSKLTMFLKDSLGGNSHTAMLATLSGHRKHTMESVSTCKFALSVSAISNSAQITEVTDKNELIKMLRKQLKELKKENNLLRNKYGVNEERGPITDSEKDRLRQQIIEFVNTANGSEDLSWVPDEADRLELSFRIVKDLFQGRTVTATSNQNVIVKQAPNVDTNLLELQTLLEQRDNEIDIVCSMNREQERVISDLKLKIARLQGNVEDLHQTTGKEAFRQRIATYGESFQQFEPFSEPNKAPEKRISIDSMLDDKYGEHLEFAKDLDVNKGLKKKLKLLNDEEQSKKMFYKLYCYFPERQELSLRVKDMINAIKEMKEHFLIAKDNMETLLQKHNKLQFDYADMHRKGENPDYSEDVYIKEELDKAKFEYKDSLKQLKKLKHSYEIMYGNLKKLDQQMGIDYLEWAERQRNRIVDVLEFKEDDSILEINHKAKNKDGSSFRAFTESNDTNVLLESKSRFTGNDPDAFFEKSASKNNIEKIQKIFCNKPNIGKLDPNSQAIIDKLYQNMDFLLQKS
eukprot:TRINITY_DN3162_c3_g1_i2.p1 TRINITY_DN3162_c3_g1~~TRINITY_DN3162_c3_g1_i2.p1  ORF type:complete len:826 (+),score=202.39 TRINITY_DN3162_c3_g1_i2:59-2536(+)